MRPIAFVLLLALGACSHSLSSTVSLATAIDGLQAQLKTAGTLSAGGGADPTVAEATAFAAAVRKQQCYLGSADPVVPVLTSGVTMTLSGAFSGTGTFTVSSLTTTPVLGLSASATRSQGQTLAVPISLVPLSNLPTVELAQQLGYESALLGSSTKSSDGVGADQAAAAEKAALLAARDALRSRIAALEASFDPTTCASTTTPAGPVVSMPRRT